MKKFLLSLLLIPAAGLLSAQSSSFTGGFTGTQGELDKSIAEKAVTFTVSGLKSQNDADFLKQRSVNYTKEIQVEVTYDQVSQTAVVKARLDDGKHDMKWLFRYFLNAHINHVSIEGKTVTTQEFFKPWL